MSLIPINPSQFASIHIIISSLRYTFRQGTTTLNILVNHKSSFSRSNQFKPIACYKIKSNHVITLYSPYKPQENPQIRSHSPGDHQRRVAESYRSFIKPIYYLINQNQSSSNQIYHGFHTTIISRSILYMNHYQASIINTFPKPKMSEESLSVES
ncbi:hypothetical protein QL285_069724 [Trifolium repens]|nr:hypothetical protein QL285_069724 [Trifolium repens]